MVSKNILGPFLRGPSFVPPIKTRFTLLSEGILAQTMQEPTSCLACSADSSRSDVGLPFSINTTESNHGLMQEKYGQLLFQISFYKRGDFRWVGVNCRPFSDRWGIEFLSCSTCLNLHSLTAILRTSRNCYCNWTPVRCGCATISIQRGGYLVASLLHFLPNPGLIVYS